jgi:hypothetical protein
MLWGKTCCAISHKRIQDMHLTVWKIQIMSVVMFFTKPQDYLQNYKCACSFMLAWKFIIHSWENELKLRVFEDTCWQYLPRQGCNSRNLHTDLCTSVSIVTEMKWKRLDWAGHEKKMIRKPLVKGQFIVNILKFFTYRNKHDFYFCLHMYRA